MVVVTSIKLNPDPIKPNLGKGSFQVESAVKDSKVVNFFELLYSHPTKYKIKWSALDELKEDLFLPSNYDILGSSLPSYIDDWLFSDNEKEIPSTSFYNLSDLYEGFLDKRYSSNFYQKQAKVIKKALASIPVYIVLNGLNEIILNKPHNPGNSQTTNKYVKQTIYNYCGAFDSSLEKRQQMGFFFMNRSDAETYLQEIAKSDINGTETVGLSIHCISLDSAYEVTREYHPGIDFRIVPGLHEVKDLLTKHLTRPSVIVEDEQQQLRFRKRNVNILPALGGLGRLLSPSSSFLQRNEYFKGVPIYIIQTLDQPISTTAVQYFNTINLADTALGKFIQIFDSLLGCGHNWIMQGSIKNIGSSEKYTNYIFFDEKSATKFIKNNQRSISRYKGSRLSNVDFLIRKPKIFIYNLEDFIESWEEKIHSKASVTENQITQSIFDVETTILIPPEQNYKEALHFFESTKSNPVTQFTQQFFQQINVKSKVFKNFIGILFSVGY